MQYETAVFQDGAGLVARVGCRGRARARAAAWFAHRFGRASDGWLVRDYDGWHLPFALIWGDRPAAAPASSGVSTAKVFRATALACFRNTWSSAPAARPVYLAIKGGNESELEPRSGPAYRHAQLDAGSFVVDGARTRWVVDLGGDEYDLPGYFEHGTPEEPGRRWRYYRTATAGHNTLVIGGRNQLPDTPVPVLGSGHAGDCSWVVLDLSAAYGEPPGSIRRAIDRIWE